jgi:dTDP-4-amino-4,6-dideoxyglucose
MPELDWEDFRPMHWPTERWEATKKYSDGNIKKSPADLVVNGGEMAFPEPLHVGRPNVPDMRRVEDRLSMALRRRELTNDGCNVRELEERLCAMTGMRHSVAVCNATMGLQIAAKALGCGYDIVMPAYTFPATATAMQWIGLPSVFADVKDYWLDPSRVQDAIDCSLTSAILGVHPYGYPRYVPELTARAKSNGCSLFYDAAGSFGMEDEGGSVLRYGECSVVSLHATKVINSGEGGFIATNDDWLAKRMRSLRNFGFAGKEYSEGEGINGKMSEVTAILALAGLDIYPEVQKHNEAIFKAYKESLPILDDPALRKNNYHYVVTRVPADKRDGVIDILRSEGVLARKYYWPGVHKTQEQWADIKLPETDKVASEVIVLPTGQQMTVWDAEIVASIVNVALEI